MASTPWSKNNRSHSCSKLQQRRSKGKEISISLRQMSCITTSFPRAFTKCFHELLLHNRTTPIALIQAEQNTTDSSEGNNTEHFPGCHASKESENLFQDS
mmetsp:Transcript_93874/g.205501  ORF Transcript_93874/g.205501 Transcript_93874/m.205501 type:complete len:100 (+) Transcript_93874:1662-1961(+)